MKAKFSPFVQRAIVKLHKKDKKIVEQIQKQIFLFESDAKHPSLRLHKLKGRFNDVWSISITSSMRMIYKIINKEIAYFVDIGTHDEVYKK